MLVLERAWGSVWIALQKEPLGFISAFRIAQQMSSALHYLFHLQIYHGALRLNTVDLLSNPRHANVIAKLTNFYRSRVVEKDVKGLAEDVRDLAVFISNLFVDECSKCVEINHSSQQECKELPQITQNCQAISALFPNLGLQLQSIAQVSLERKTTEEFDDCLYELQGMLQECTTKSRQKTVEQHSEKRVVHL